MEESQPDSVPLYRIENPHHPNPRTPDGVTSHEDIVGQWFSSDLEATVNYLSKSTQNNGLPIDGAQLVIAHVPRTQLNSLHVTQHETAKDMDVENDNYIVPRDGSVEIQEIPLDPIIGDLRGRLNRVPVRLEALERIQKIGGISVKNHE
jgi:hypothetical protein